LSRRKKWIVAVLGLVVVLFGWFALFGGTPMARYYRLEIDVVADGRKVTLGGELVCRCEGRGWTQGGGYTYGLPSPVTFAAKLENGDVIGMRPKSFCLEDLPKDLAAFAPAIFRFEKAAGKDGAPPRILAHVHPEALRDKKQPVHISAVRAGPRRSSGFLDLFRRVERPRSIRDLVPWARAPQWQKKNKPQWFYRGYLAGWNGLDTPAGKHILQFIPPQPHDLTKVPSSGGWYRKIETPMFTMPSAGLVIKPDWTAAQARCQAGFRVLCPAALRQRAMHFKPSKGRHIITIPDVRKHGPLVLLPVEGGPPPRYLNAIGYSGDQEHGKRIPGTLIIGKSRIDVSAYFNDLIIDWKARRILRLLMVEVEPSLFN